MKIKKGQLAPEILQELFEPGLGGIYFSQACEDVVLCKLFERKKNGFYVDIGAHHPVRFSNTYLLHRFSGWSGINIDADPSAIARLEAARPKDRNVLAAISDIPDQELKITIYTDGAVNTLDDGMRARRVRRKSIIEREEIVRTRTLASILDEHLTPGQEIDFFDVDVEGFDYKALLSNDWTKYRPSYVFVEMHKFSLAEIDKSAVVRLMRDVGYEMTSFLLVTGMFRRL
jgi:FkbM family methyltransferase